MAKSRLVFDTGIGMLLAVEDPQGDTAYLKLFNYTPLLDTNEIEQNIIMPIGTVLVIREPTYAPNLNIPELPFVKVDSPSDVIFVNSSDGTPESFIQSKRLY